MKLLLALILAVCSFSVAAQGRPINCPDTGGNHLNFLTATNRWVCGTSGAGGSLSGLTAATAANSINNGDFAQTWNWALTTAAKSAFTFTENTAAINGAGAQYLLDVKTLSSSTAVPFRVNARSGTLDNILISSSGVVTIRGSTSQGVNVLGGAGSATGAGETLNLRGGAGGATSGNGGQAQLISGSATDGSGGNTILQASSGTGTNRNGGTINVTAGNSTGSGTAGTITLTSGTGGATSAGAIILLQAGSGGSTNGDGGAISIVSGSPVDGNGGAVSITAKDAVGTNRNGGTITLTAGDNTGTGTEGNIQFVVAGGSNVLRVNGVTKHFSIMGITPTMGACGTSPSIVGKDQALFITVGTGGTATSCAVTFANAFTNAPICVAQSDTDLTALQMVTTTTTATISKATAFTASSKLHVICMSYE